MLPTNPSFLRKCPPELGHTNNGTESFLMYFVEQIYTEYLTIFVDILKKCKPHHMGLNTRNLSLGFWNNIGADQPAHLRSLISAFVIHLLESIMYELA